MLSQVEALKVELRKVEAWASQADCNGKRATRDAEAAGRDAAAAGGSVELLTRKVGQLEHQVRPLEAGESVARLLTARNPRSAEERVRERERERERRCLAACVMWDRALSSLRPLRRE
jgi:hypothetical protein